MGANYHYITVESRSKIKLVKEDGTSFYLPTFTPGKTIIKKYSTRPLLRYPGGKTRAVNLITKLIPLGTKELCSPFLGGGSIELACTGRGIFVYGYDIFTPLVEFWECLLDDPQKLAKEVEKYFPLSRERFYELQKIQTEFKKKIERAAVFYVLNRSSFSGSTLSGGMSPNHPRFTISSIQRLRNFYNPNIKVEKKDFRESISLHPEKLLYLDPPYIIKNSLYGRNGDAHKGFDHLKLYEILSERDNWILSYNNCTEILKLYKNYKILFPVWKYGMSNDKKSNEVLILSKDLQAYHGI